VEVFGAVRNPRLDVLLVARGLAESREKAQRLIRSGVVSVDGVACSKPGVTVSGDCALAVKERPRFASRGGVKLEHAFAVFALDVAVLPCLDIGSSTGGFTDCLLQHGASRVMAVDVGRGLLDWRLRNDPRVTVMEGVNARYLRPGDLPLRPRFVCVDVSFISLTKILPAVIDLVEPGSAVVTLIKPQFEAGREHVQKGGVVRDPAAREAAVAEVVRFGSQGLGLQSVGLCESPLRGPAGNVEYLACWRVRGGEAKD
jgi:23S rRNA (cytidine1920-2'-O)/16S rRNA (cytidine1409-2'-O)-methyltransferase